MGHIRDRIYEPLLELGYLLVLAACDAYNERDVRLIETAKRCQCKMPVFLRASTRTRQSEAGEFVMALMQRLKRSVV